jgi:hypothetical protein
VKDVFKDFPTQNAYGLEFSHPIVGQSGREVKVPELTLEGETFVVRESAI